MIKGKARKDAIEMYIKVFGKRPDRAFDPFIDFVHQVEYKGIARAAKAEDRLFLMHGLIQGAKDHFRKYGMLMKKYEEIRRVANSKTAEANKQKKRADKYEGWIKKKFADWHKKKNNKLKVAVKKKRQIKIRDKDKKK